MPREAPRVDEHRGRWILVLGALTLVLLLNINAHSRSSQGSLKAAILGRRSNPVEESPPESPSRRRTTVLYPEDTQRYGAFDADDWRALLPPPSEYGSHGILHLPLSGSAPDSKRYPLTIAMFHQLHCLDVIREEITAPSDDWVHEAEPGVCRGENRAAVANHCMNYLRQMTLCRADTALDSVRSLFPPPIIDLPQSRYECFDWSAVYDSWPHHTYADQ